MWTAFMTPVRGENEDEDLRVRIEEDLRRQNFDSLRSVEVDVLSGIVLLSGNVDSYHEKQIAQEVWKRVAGILGVQNELLVRRQLARAS